MKIKDMSSLHFSVICATLVAILIEVTMRTATPNAVFTFRREIFIFSTALAVGFLLNHKNILAIAIIFLMSIVMAAEMSFKTDILFLLASVINIILILYLIWRLTSSVFSGPVALFASLATYWISTIVICICLEEMLFSRKFAKTTLGTVFLILILSVRVSVATVSLNWVVKVWDK